MSRIVVALGGNALGKSPEEQLKIVRDTAKNLVDLVEKGNEIIITHGNGPQVGMIYNAMASEKMPFPECGAMSQGYIGYHLQQAMEREFELRKIDKNVMTIISQVEVDKVDPAFKKPTKPIGSFYTKEEAMKLARQTDTIYKEDANRGYRRVVASPIPRKICELDAILKSVNKKCVVITCGGGGIPVIYTEDGYKGVDAVIDKDRTSALLATKLRADILLILTAVDEVKINFGTVREKGLKKVTLEEIKKHLKNGEFKEGSMLPKVEACLYFLNHSKNTKAIITSLDKAKEAIDGKFGTTIVRGGV